MQLNILKDVQYRTVCLFTLRRLFIFLTPGGEKNNYSIVCLFYIKVLYWYFNAYKISHVLFVYLRLVSWRDVTSGEGFSLEYPHISLHAVSRDLSSFPHECLYLMLDADVEKTGEFIFLTQVWQPDGDCHHLFILDIITMSCNLKVMISTIQQVQSRGEKSWRPSTDKLCFIFITFQ